MLLRNLLHDCGPWPEGADPDAIVDALKPVWRGARVFMTRQAAKREWRRERREPRGAAERLAHDVEAAIGAGGGSCAHVERCLVGCMSSYLEI